jgi:hypothetical protein
MPVDKRPAIEHEGDSIGTSFFFTIGMVTHWSRRGNYITDDPAASSNMPSELHTGMIEALRAANVAKTVVPNGNTEFLLETEVEHLYGTHYATNDGTVVIVNTSSRNAASTFGSVGVGSRAYASYGNVILHAKLYDRRSGQASPVWEETVSGVGQQAPEKNHIIATQTALREAFADAMATLSVRVGAALDRLQRGPSGPNYAIVGQLPPAFMIERISRYRSFLERVYVDTATGRVLRHEVLPNADPALARPGEWLLSRRSPEGLVLSPEAYESYARALALRYDLRRVDDAYRYHFFGVKPVLSPPIAKP